MKFSWLDHFRGALHHFDGSAGIFPGDGDVSGAAEMRSNERMEQATLGEKAKLQGKIRQYHGRVHIALWFAIYT